MSTMAPARKPKIPTGKQIKAIRERLGLTQAEAAAKVRVSQSVWSAWERGATRPSPSSVLLIELLDRGSI